MPSISTDSITPQLPDTEQGRQQLFDLTKQKLVSQHPALNDNFNFDQDLSQSFQDFWKGTSDSSDSPDVVWSRTVQPALDKWEKGLAGQASRALDSSAMQFFSNPASASPQDANKLLDSKYRTEVVSVLNKIRQPPAAGSSGHYTGHGDQPGDNDTTELPGENYRAFANAHNNWSKNAPPKVIPGKIWDSANPKFEEYVKQNPEPKLRDFLGQLPGTAATALGRPVGLPNLQSSPANAEIPSLPQPSEQAFGRTYSDPNTSQTVRYMGPTGGVQTAEQAAAILSGKSPQSVLGSSRPLTTSGTTTSAAAVLSPSDEAEIMGTAKPTNAKEKAALANKTAQAHPDWTRKQIIDFVNQQ